MQSTNSNDIYLSPSPHFSSPIKSWQIMLCVIVALLPECVMGVIYFGLPALITILVSVASCVLFEGLFQKLIKQPVQIKDLSAVVTGILLALTLPSTTPIWMTILGAFFAIVVTKGFFGGIGSNVWNPALAGRAFLFISFPVAMGQNWVPSLKGASKTVTDALTSATSVDVLTSATPLALGEHFLDFFTSKQGAYWNLFTGNHGGTIGETCIIAILASFIFLLITGVIDWRAPLTMVLTSSIFTFVFGEKGFFTGDVIFNLLSGGLLFGATFMVTDYTTAPVTKKGRLVFGAGCGLITFLIRRFGGYPEGVMFSILIMNSIVPFLNKLSGRKYGYGLKKSQAKKEIKNGGKA